MRKTYAGIALAVIVIAAAFAALSYMRENWGANAAPGALERFVARWFLARSQSGDAELKNPLPVTEEILQAGRELYEKRCAFCHGLDGKGPGENGVQFYPPVPSLAPPRAGLTDSQMHYIVQRGIRYTAMPSFEKALTPEETWKVIEWIDHFSDAQH